MTIGFHGILCVLLAWLAGGPQAPLDAAIAGFDEACRSGTPAQREAALDALIAVEHHEAAAPIRREHASTSRRLRDWRGREAQARHALDYLRRSVEALETRAKVDPKSAPAAERERKRLDELEQEHAKSERACDENEAWRATLTSGLARLCDELGPARRRKVEDELEAIAQSQAPIDERLSAVELHGDVASPGGASAIAKWIGAASDAVIKEEARLPKLMIDVREMEARMQKEGGALGGRLTEAIVEQYDAVKADAAAARTRVHEGGLFLRACANAGGRALLREPAPMLEKSVQALMRTIKGRKDRGRLDLIAMLARAPCEPVRASVRLHLAAEKDPQTQAAWIDALAELGDLESETALIERWLAAEHLLVRSHAIGALSKLRSAKAVPALIARLEVETGRTRTDLTKALIGLTGQRFTSNVEIWKRWWADNAGSFRVAEGVVVEQAAADASSTTGVTFFGITTESQRVLFVLDLSGSMDFAIEPRNNPDDSSALEPDRPLPGEPSRLDVAKAALVQALAGIRDGGLFNFVLFASDVWTWDEQLVEMDAKTRAEALAFVEKSTALGGTNIYGALEKAFDLIEADDKRGPTIDTIYLLTDGRASIGVTTDSEELLAMVRTRNRELGVALHTIGLSGAHDASLLRRLAEENGGTYGSR